jgi:hypothetical protein
MIAQIFFYFGEKNPHVSDSFCVYSEKLLIIDRGTVRNMWIFLPKIKKSCEISASSWFIIRKFVTMHGHMNVKLTKTLSMFNKRRY